MEIACSSARCAHINAIPRALSSALYSIKKKTIFYPKSPISSKVPCIVSRKPCILTLIALNFSYIPSKEFNMILYDQIFYPKSPI